MERDAIDWTMNFSDISLPIEDDIQVHLLVEVDGNDMDLLFKDYERIASVMEKYGCAEILFADTVGQKDQLWRLRRSVGEAVKVQWPIKKKIQLCPFSSRASETFKRCQNR